MRKIKNNNLIILIPIIILMIMSILNMLNARLIMTQYENFYFKQILWFIIGFLIIIAVSKFNIEYLFKYSYFIYGINIFFLILVLFFGKEVNGARAWFDLSYFSFQPSELMKISLILVLTNLTNSIKYKTIRNELKFIAKALLLTLLPAILTFLEPDTGAVIIYFIIAVFILFAAQIRYRWFIIAVFILFASLFSLFYFYNNYQDEFIKIFGTDFFYRIDRLMLFKDGNGMQIENALLAIGSAGIWGSGINTVAIYFPEAPTDFIFALSISNFGLIGALLILICYLFISLFFLNIIIKSKRKEHKIFMSAFLAMFLFQVIQSIFMNLGITPIIGITLPFLSYGGSSTIICFICMAIALAIKTKENL